MRWEKKEITRKSTTLCQPYLHCLQILTFEPDFTQKTAIFWSIICKRSANPDYQFARGQSLRMIICNHEKDTWNNFNSRDASKIECMNDWRRCKSNAELLKCCFTCIRHIQSAFLHSGISHMYKLYFKCKYLYIDIS